MIHGIETPMETKRKVSRVTGFRIHILDDETFTLRTDNTNYEMQKEYSYQNVDELNKGIKSILGKMDKKSSDSDALSAKKEY